MTSAACRNWYLLSSAVPRVRNMKGAENTAAPNMIVDEFFPKHIRQREDFAEIREAVRKYRITELYLTQKYNRKQVGYAR